MNSLGSTTPPWWHLVQQSSTNCFSWTTEIPLRSGGKATLAERIEALACSLPFFRSTSSPVRLLTFHRCHSASRGPFWSITSSPALTAPLQPVMTGKLLPAMGTSRSANWQRKASRPTGCGGSSASAKVSRRLANRTAKGSSSSMNANSSALTCFADGLAIGAPAPAKVASIRGIVCELRGLLSTGAICNPVSRKLGCTPLPSLDPSERCAGIRNSPSWKLLGAPDSEEDADDQPWARKSLAAIADERGESIPLVEGGVPLMQTSKRNTPPSVRFLLCKWTSTTESRSETVDRFKIPRAMSDDPRTVPL
mmetsp:Transcript_124715/g.285723  ORF Transcript_124715/g.285723 Transcript_124715/m.285723 type:complete len:309 (+) Transcript_124715:1473-2399(+)